ncbi:MAG TPA: radical SAM protein [Candidatus Omnitrophota bacterium]|nr:radical SAM protein [Candidatus Omnitrophota bacterium]
MTSRIIRKTQSVCPRCLETLDTFIVERNTKIVMQKTCLRHGLFEIVLSSTPLYYAELEEYYFSLADTRYEVPEYEFWPTYRCNADCTICCFGRQNWEMTGQDASTGEIEKLAKNCKKRFFIISGGDPTCRDDLGDIIRTFHKHGKVVTINTNGLKCADLNYLKKLQDAGLDRMNLQFDGFDRRYYLALRRQDYLDIKLKVLENLQALRIQTTFNATIARNLNEGAVKELMDFASTHPFINGVNLFSICFLGGARNWDPSSYIMPDEMIDVLISQIRPVISKKNIFIFQKLHLSVKSFLAQKWCFYNQVYLFVRRNGSFEPIDRFLNLAKAEPWLDRYRKNFKTRPFWARACLGIAVGCLFLKKKSVIILKEILLRSVSYFLKTRQYLRGSRFFSVSFSTGCDPYKFDFNIVKHCQNEIIAAQGQDGALTHLGSDGMYCMGLEKRHLIKKSKKEGINSL